jgi:MFS transporter, DHA2 family, multidrug resistance protein
MLTGATMLFVTQYFEVARGVSPVRAGLCMVPAAVTMAGSALGAAPLARRIRPAYVIAAGLALAAGGLLLIGQVNGLAPVVAGWALVTLGSGPMVVLSVDLVIGAAPPARAGAAAALNETGSQLGFALGIAALGGLSMRVAATTSAVLLVVVALIAVFLLRHVGRGGEQAQSAAPDRAAEAPAPAALR